MMGYVGAPYNFIPLNKNVYEKYENLAELPSHSEINEKLYSGEIHYSIKPNTDIMVGGADGEHFYKDVNGNYAIPGSTIRGLTRSTVQILGFSSLGDDIEDYMLMHRNVAEKTEYKLLKKRYKEILGIKIENKNGNTFSTCKNVKAGYLVKEKDKYYIYPAKELNKKSFFSLRENYILEDIEKSKSLNKESSFKVLEGKLQSTKIEGKGKNAYCTKNDRYIPYNKEVSYELFGEKVTAVGEKGKYKNNGFVLSSGFMNKKKALYIIPEKNLETEKISISEEDLISYKKDYEAKKNQLGTTYLKDEALKDKSKAFFDLPKSGETKAVFYINYDGKLYFGYTQYLRLFHKYSIMKGVPEGHSQQGKKNPIKWDYAKSMFGFTNDKASYKSRLSFKDAVYTDKKATIEARQVVLAGPKPSSYLDYLEQNDKEDITTYSHDEFKIRGVKQYWLRDEVVKNSGGSKDNVSSTINVLKKTGEICFKGSIHFKNLDKDELGLLLWSLQLGEGYAHNIGKAKPYGYGNISVNVDKVKVINYSKMYDLSSLCYDIYDDYSKEKIAECISFYKDKMMKEKGKEIEKELNISTFFMMKDIEQKPKPENIRYMDIGEYQGRIDPLKRPGDLIERKKVEKAVQKKEDVLTGKLCKYHNGSGEIEYKGKKYKIDKSITAPYSTKLMKNQEIKFVLNSKNEVEKIIL